MRINKYLASSGLGSRRKVEELIKSGKVIVNGQKLFDLSYDVKDNDNVVIDQKNVKIEEKKVYIMLNKPKCYLTSVSDDRGRKTVIQLIKGNKLRIFPVGRLDYNTEGLLILTNDGDFANSIIHPKQHISKTYEVCLKTKPSNKDLSRIKAGIQLADGTKYLPAKVSNIKDNIDKSYTVFVTIFEGKNREIRKIFEELKITILNLKRISIGNLKLDVDKGKFRYLTELDLSKIF